MIRNEQEYQAALSRRFNWVKKQDAADLTADRLEAEARAQRDYSHQLQASILDEEYEIAKYLDENPEAALKAKEEFEASCRGSIIETEGSHLPTL